MYTQNTCLDLRFASWMQRHCNTYALRYACKPFEQPAQVPRKFGLASTQPHRKCYKSAMSSNNRPLYCLYCPVSRRIFAHDLVMSGGDSRTVFQTGCNVPWAHMSLLRYNVTFLQTSFLANLFSCKHLF